MKEFHLTSSNNWEMNESFMPMTLKNAEPYLAISTIVKQTRVMKKTG